MDNEKLLTIAIPTYNGANTISNMLEILLPQCDERVEILISDNASTDNTKLIIDKYIEKYENIIYVRNAKNIGSRFQLFTMYGNVQGEVYIIIVR